MIIFKHKRHVLLTLSAGLILAAISLHSTPGLAQDTTQYCLSCHENPQLQVELPDGEKLPLYIKDEIFSKSIHGVNGIECQACHTSIQTYPHPKITYTSRRELSRAYYQACQKCHPANYEKAQDSIHAEIAAAGKLQAPICTDCHGAHDVRAPNQPRTRISITCGQCHDAIYQEYSLSAHGKALEEGNPDVPVCTDCHGVHNIQDPRTTQFHIKTPELCAGCHANQELMRKYNLPANVYDLYKLSWHGVDVSIYKARWPTIWHNSAVCTDCHGIHNIRPTKDTASMVNPANLLATCQKCHPGAGPNWTGAWTGHNEISLNRTPFLYYTNAFYSSFVLVILWLSVIYVVLQIIRASTERIRRNLR